MKTTHQIAQELLALPDVPLHIEGWCRMEGYETSVEMLDEDCCREPTAIVFQKALNPESPCASPSRH